MGLIRLSVNSPASSAFLLMKKAMACFIGMLANESADGSLSVALSERVDRPDVHACHKVTLHRGAQPSCRHPNQQKWSGRRVAKCLHPEKTQSRLSALSCRSQVP